MQRTVILMRREEARELFPLSELQWLAESELQRQAAYLPWLEAAN